VKCLAVGGREGIGNQKRTGDLSELFPFDVNTRGSKEKVDILANKTRRLRRVKIARAAIGRVNGGEGVGDTRKGAEGGQLGGKERVESQRVEVSGQYNKRGTIENYCVSCKGRPQHGAAERC